MKSQVNHSKDSVLKGSSKGKGRPGRARPNREAAFAVDENNRVVYWDEGAARLLGFDQTQVLNRHLGEILTAWDEFGNRYPVGNESLHDMARLGEDIRRFAIEIARSDGSPVRVFSSVEVIRPPNNGSHQLSFRLRTDQRKRQTTWDLQQPIRREVANLKLPLDHEKSSSGEPEETVSLSPRQTEVLEMLSEGKRCGEIANELNVSVCTARRHVQNAMERLDAHTQAEAVAKSIRMNLI